MPQGRASILLQPQDTQRLAGPSIGTPRPPLSSKPNTKIGQYGYSQKWREPSNSALQSAMFHRDFPHKPLQPATINQSGLQMEFASPLKSRATLLSANTSVPLSLCGKKRIIPKSQ